MQYTKTVHKTVFFLLLILPNWECSCAGLEVAHALVRHSWWEICRHLTVNTGWSSLSCVRLWYMVELHAFCQSYMLSPTARGPRVEGFFTFFFNKQFCTGLRVRWDFPVFAWGSKRPTIQREIKGSGRTEMNTDRKSAVLLGLCRDEILFRNGIRNRCFD